MSGLQIGATSWCFRDVEGRARIRAFFRDQLTALRDALVALGFEPYPIAGGIYALTKVPASIAGRKVASAEEAAVILMDEYDLAVVPWDPAPRHYLRFTSMYRPEDLDLLARLLRPQVTPAIQAAALAGSTGDVRDAAFQISRIQIAADNILASIES